MSNNRLYGPRDDALGICAKSGKQMRLGDMVRDGYYEGLLVDPDWYDPPHPQEKLLPVFDPEGIQDPSPDLDGAQSEALVLNVPVYRLSTNSVDDPFTIFTDFHPPTLTIT